MTRPVSLSTWYAPGPDECVFCLSTTSVEVCYFCADCDRLVCAGCVSVERKTQHILCPECAPGEPD